MNEKQKEEIVQFSQNLEALAFAGIDEKKLLAMNDAEFLVALLDHLRANFESCGKKSVLRLSIPVWDCLNFTRMQKQKPKKP